MDAEVLKSYLIKLGVQVDTSAFDKMKQIMNDLEKAMGKNASSMGLQMVKGAGLAVGALVAIDTAIVNTVKKIADADMAYQLLGQQMFMTTQAAKAFKQATDTLGHSLEEIAWNAELKERYIRLVQQVNDLKLPPEADNMFKQVRGIGFEFDRLKLASTQVLERMSYELLKLNKGGMQELQTRFSAWVDDFISKVPEYGRKLAEFFDPFIKVSKSAIEALRDLWTYFEPIRGLVGDIFDKLSSTEKIIASLGLGIAIFLVGGPWAVGLAAIATALLLIDDYMGFKNGKRSLPQLIFLWGTFGTAVKLVEIVLGNIAIALEHIWYLLHGRPHPSGLSWWARTKDFNARKVEELEAELAFMKKQLDSATRRETKREQRAYLRNAFIDAYRKELGKSGITVTDEEALEAYYKNQERKGIKIIRKKKKGKGAPTPEPEETESGEGYGDADNTAPKEGTGKFFFEVEKPATQSEIEAARKHVDQLVAEKRKSGAPESGVNVTRGAKNNNPGNLKYDEFAINHGATGSDGKFAVFPDIATGIQAQRESLLKDGKNRIDDSFAPKGEAGYLAPSAVSAPAYQGLTESEKAFLIRISKGEGTSEEEARSRGYATGYDVPLGYGKWGKPNKPISTMTFKELKEFQTEMINNQLAKGGKIAKNASSAAGKFQFIKRTLFGYTRNGKHVPGLLENEGISENEVFSPEMQNRLALALIKEATNKFKTGKMSAADYHNIVSSQWASVTKYGVSGGTYEGQRAPTTTAHLAPIFESLKREPVRPPTFARTGSRPPGPSLASASPPGVSQEALAGAGTGGDKGSIPVINLTSIVNAQTNDPAELVRLNAQESKKMLTTAQQETNIKRRQG